jgi:hypothetical protein
MMADNEPCTCDEFNDEVRSFWQDLYDLCGTCGRRQPDAVDA